MATDVFCAECGRYAQVNLTSDGPSLCLVCAGLDDMADADYGGAFDGFTVTSDADPGL